MPSFAVVVVETPANAADRRQGAWPAFSSAVARICAHNPKELQPSENIWLIPLPSETPVLACVVASARQFEIPHRVLYFDQPPSEYKTSSP